MSYIGEIIESSILIKQQILRNDLLLSKIESVANSMELAIRDGGRILICGNGGSAADAQHLAAELSGRFYIDRPPLDAEALHVNTSFLTAVANDYGYDEVFARLVGAKGRKGDVLVGISTSGNSINIIKAFERAKSLGLMTVAMTGSTGGRMAGIVDILLNMPSLDTPRIQEAHILIGHIICELVEKRIFG